MDSEGWNDYCYHRPPNVLCLFQREGSAETFVAFPSEFWPEFNVAGLRWKLTGLGREALERMPPEMRVQAEAPSNMVLLMQGLMGAELTGSSARQSQRFLSSTSSV